MKHIKNILLMIVVYLIGQCSIASLIAIGGPWGDTAIKAIGLYMIAILTIALAIWIVYKLNLLNGNTQLFTKKNIIYYIIGVAILAGTSYLGQYILSLQGQGTTENNLKIEAMFGHASPFIIVIVMGFIGPIIEEFVFRGILMNILFKGMPIISVILSGALFGVAHAQNDFISFLIYSFAGLTLAYIYKKTQRLEVTMLIHITNNMIASIIFINALH